MDSIPLMHRVASGVPNEINVGWLKLIKKIGTLNENIFFNDCPTQIFMQGFFARYD